MIVYFADRSLTILGQASTGLPEGLTIKSDLKTEDIETGVSVFECTIQFDSETRSKVEECADVGNYILRSHNGENEFYTIIESEVDKKKQRVDIYAEDAGLDLLNEICGEYAADKAYPISHYINKFAYDSGFEIGVNEAESLTRKLSWDGEATATERIASVATQFDGCEVSYSFDIKGLQIEHKYINIYKKRGNDVGTQLRINEDISRIITKKSIANLATALLATGGIPEDSDLPINLSGYTYDDGDIYLDGKYLKSRSAVEKWSRYLNPNEPHTNYTGHILKTYSYDTTSQSELCAHAVTRLKKISDMEINYEVDITNLPENLRLGDRVNIVDDAGGLYVSARVLQLETSVIDNEQKATIGEYLIKTSGISQSVADMAEQFAKSAQDILKARAAANAAKVDAQNAQSAADNAQNAIDAAETSISNAQAAADAAKEAADAAKAKADQAATDAANAQSAADNAATAASNAQAEANAATAAAAAAQIAADEADAKAAQAANDLAVAKQNLENVTSRVDATEEEITAAQQAVVAAQAAADAAAADAAAAQKTADTAQANAETAQTAANNAKTAADNAQAAADEAAKTATNFLYYDATNGLQVGNKSSGAWSGYRTQIKSDSFNVLNADGETMSKFGANEISLGDNGDNTAIYLCNKRMRVVYDSYTAWANIVADTINAVSDEPRPSDYWKTTVFLSMAPNRKYARLSASGGYTDADGNAVGTIGQSSDIFVQESEIDLNSDVLVYVKAPTITLDTQIDGGPGVGVGINGDTDIVGNVTIDGTLESSGARISGDFETSGSAKIGTSATVGGKNVLTTADVQSGSWTPKCASISSPTQAVGYYTKVGDYCTISFCIYGTSSSTSTSSTSLRITGLPFTPDTSVKWYAGGGNISGVQTNASYAFSGYVIENNATYGAIILPRCVAVTTSADTRTSGYCTNVSGGTMYMSGTIMYKVA